MLNVLHYLDCWNVPLFAALFPPAVMFPLFPVLPRLSALHSPSVVAYSLLPAVPTMVNMISVTEW